MVKKCLYCGCELPDESVIDFCHRCGIGVFGEKMFSTIKQNMETARNNGDLCHANNTCPVPQETPNEVDSEFFH
tara:strand:+ start:418 stop:639 length:222 start_codon:yes stop_codon:yes gene_type:complete